MARPASKLAVRDARLRRFGFVEWGRVAAACGGLGAIAIALLSPIDEWAPRLFWVHMLQHLLLVYLAAPLFALAAPLLLDQQSFRTAISQRNPLRRFFWLASPAGAFGLSTALLWLWHLPAVYDLALQNDGVHAVEHLSFLGEFALYWWVLVDTAGGRHRLNSNGARALYLLAGATQAALLGAVLTLSDRAFYAHYLIASPPSGLTALADQHFGGALMWLPGPVVYGLAAALVMRDE